ncbi:leucine-rich repeat-containing 42 [Pelobates cultripes]|uniref:Leucine-rich repeat-containing protein 42 n=1 Tax=Pelobates cultripes TaxID=61616 RepID=A0AAD1SU19_PELCU|nr:leucine-rich repeat-containing 42 [Pelobates cultripes]
MSYCPEVREDGGPVYVRENGKLFLAGSHLSNSRTRSVGLFSRAFSVELCLKHEDASRHKEKSFFFTYTEHGSLRYSAKPLFNLTLDFIADNIQYVDSLIGFPEQIAEKLFTAAEVRQKFHRPGSGLKALQKFTEAYGDLILSSLCLRGRYLLVSEKLEEIQSFQGLRSLDLSYCKLGDEHELIGHFTSEALNSLQELYLKDNCLSDTGIRRMTAPTRVLRKGLGNLTVLDLSDNQGITDIGVTFLFVFKMLHFLDISGTSIQDATIGKIEKSIGLKHSKEQLTRFDHVNCTTEGWAEQLFNQWEKYILSAIKSKRKDKAKPQTAAQTFYRKEKKQSQQDLKMCILQNTPTQARKHLQFYKLQAKENDTVYSESTTNENSTNRALENGRQATNPDPNTKQPSFTFSDADWEMLNSY